MRLPLNVLCKEDVDAADSLKGVTGTPTFLVNDRLHEGDSSFAYLDRFVREAAAR
jgi:protein-disulfide isomerase